MVFQTGYYLLCPLNDFSFIVFISPPLLVLFITNLLWFCSVYCFQFLHQMHVHCFAPYIIGLTNASYIHFLVFRYSLLLLPITYLIVAFAFLDVSSIGCLQVSSMCIPFFFHLIRLRPTWALSLVCPVSLFIQLACVFFALIWILHFLTQPFIIPICCCK